MAEITEDNLRTLAKIVVEANRTVYDTPEWEGSNCFFCPYDEKSCINNSELICIENIIQYAIDNPTKEE